MRKLALLLLLLTSAAARPAAFEEGQYILIITSFNMEIERYRDNIADLHAAVAEEHPEMNYIVENLGTSILEDFREWRGRMQSFLDKYDDNRPQAVVLLGNEATAAYVDLDNDFTRRVPAFVMLANEWLADLPEIAFAADDWAPRMYQAQIGARGCNIVGGVVYHFDIARNIDIAMQLYPGTRRLTFFIGNSFDGINFLGLINKWKRERRDKYNLDIKIISGRDHSFREAGQIYRQMKDGYDLCVFSAWKMDRTGKYFIINSARDLLEYNPRVPGITLTGTGLGYVAVGGITPKDGLQGGRIGRMICRYLATGKPQRIETAGQVYRCHHTILRKWNIDTKLLPEGYLETGHPRTLYQKSPQLFTLFCCVSGILILVIIFVAAYYRMKQRGMRQLQATNRELEIARDKAEEADKMKSKFLANMSHEIRTPLNSIVGFSEVIVENHREMDDDELQSIFHLIRQNTELLLKLVSDVLLFSRIEADSLALFPERTEIVALCRNVADSELITHKDSPVELRYHADKDEIWLDTDQRYLQQIIINLVNNAYKFTHQGHIDIDVEDLGNAVRFTVTDTGIGIPADKHDTIFQRFEKLDDFAQGTGLGLPISRSIVERMNGEIHIDPQYTQGARFVFTIPKNNPTK